MKTVPRGVPVIGTPLQKQIAEMYRSGRTQSEIATDLNIGQGSVWRALNAESVQKRRSGARDQSGELNRCWRGDAVSYKGAHGRVSAWRGRPRLCEECGTTTAKFYDWANLTGNYSDVSDYKRMCRACHHAFDKMRRRQRAASHG